MIRLPANPALDSRDDKIRAYFSDPFSPHLYISYEQFVRHFKPNDNNFKQENRNIIDIHLRYRWLVREKMAPYKWGTIALMTPFLYSSTFLLMTIPMAFAWLFDRYFERFFVWRYQKDKIINMRHQFCTKLSKEKNKIRRINLFEALKTSFQRKEQVEQVAKDHKEWRQKKQILQDQGVAQDKIKSMLPEQPKLQPPIKYLKFGEFTQYLFHTNLDEKEESSFVQTTFFESYLSLKRLFSFNGPGLVWNNLKGLVRDWTQFRRDPDHNLCFMNPKELLDHTSLKGMEIYTFEDNFDDSVRRWSQLLGWVVTGKVQKSRFRSWNYYNFSKDEFDFFDKIKFNEKTNGPDLLLFYMAVGVPKIFSYLFRRR